MHGAHTSGVAVTETVWSVAIRGGLETSANHIEQLSTVVPRNNQKAFAEGMLIFC